MGSTEEGYKPGPEFEEDTKDPLVDISLSDSKELWLIQWPINQLQPADFHGKELKLKLHRDGHLGGFESSSGKSYDVVSYAAQKPDATVFMASASESKVGSFPVDKQRAWREDVVARTEVLVRQLFSKGVMSFPSRALSSAAVGKISRRVCLVRYPEPSELEKPSFNNPNLSSMRSGGSLRKSMSHLTSTHSIGQRSIESSKHSRKRRHEDSRPLAEASAKSLERSGASGLESQISNASLGSEPSHGEKSKKKRKIKLEE